MPINKGNYAYLGEENSGLSLVGAGSTILNFVGDVILPEPGFIESDITSEDYYYIAIKNVSEGNAAIQARSIYLDDFSQTGAYSHGTTARYIEIPYGDIIYGKFDKVSLEEPSLGTSSLRLIKGGQ